MNSVSIVKVIQTKSAKMPSNCLNCEKVLTDAFCSGCGQKADTHRITFKNFLFHDLLHGTFHVDKGMWFTAKQSLIRPGKAALDYISGKRKRYYNVFYLILIVYALTVFFIHFSDVFDSSPKPEVVPEKEYFNEASRKMDEIIFQKIKMFVLLFVPIAALTALVLFRRKKLNFSEHCIISGMILLGMLLLNLMGNLFFYFELIVPFNGTFSWMISWTVTILITLQIARGYWNAFRTDYSRLGISLRILAFYALFALELFIIFLAIYGYVTDWKFTAVRLSPFR